MIWTDAAAQLWESYLAKKKQLACASEEAHGSLQQRIRNDKRKLSNTLGTGTD